MTENPVTNLSGRYKLSTRTQITYLSLAALAALFLFFGVPALIQLFAPKPPPPPAAAPPGTFVATNEQWATLKFVTVAPSGFVSQAVTEGKIATDDDRTTQVFSPYSGRVTRVMAKAGDEVRAGQPLFAVQGSELAQGQADLATALAQVRLTQAAETRQSELVKSNGAAVKDLQQSQADLATANANLEAVRSRLRILGLSASDEAGLEQGASLKGAGAEAIVASPIAGVVTQRAVGEGQNIGSVTNGGTSPAFVVSDLSTVWLVGQLREDDAALARIGETVNVKVAALPNQVFTAKVDFISPTVDPVTHRVVVRASLPNPGGVLKPEMFAAFTLLTDGVTNSIGVPEEAVIFEGDTARVWVTHAGHALELRQIKTGRIQDGLVEVVAGLQPGEEIVTSGSLFIDRASQGD